MVAAVWPALCDAAKVTTYTTLTEDASNVLRLSLLVARVTDVIDTALLLIFKYFATPTAYFCLKSSIPAGVVGNEATVTIC